MARSSPSKLATLGCQFAYTTVNGAESSSARRSHHRQSHPCAHAGGRPVPSPRCRLRELNASRNAGGSTHPTVEVQARPTPCMALLVPRRVLPTTRLPRLPRRPGLAGLALHFGNHVVDDVAVLPLGAEHDDLRIGVDLHVVPGRPVEQVVRIHRLALAFREGETFAADQRPTGGTSSAASMGVMTSTRRTSSPSEMSLP
jgi:hypothetical protein